jgi:molecular chaperone DnaK
LDEAEKISIESAIAGVEEAVAADDVDEINSKVEALMQASHKLAEQMYAQAAEQDGADQGEPQQTADDDNVVDAEFEEVNDDADDKKA